MPVEQLGAKHRRRHAVAVLICVWSGLAWAGAFSVRTQDGLRLALSGEGRVTGLAVGKQVLALSGPGGFFVADYRNQPVPKNLVPNAGFEQGAKG